MNQPDANVTPGAPPPKKKSGCMGCSWGCIIPAGCLTVLMLGCGGFFTFTMAVPFYITMQSDAYTIPIQRAKADARVKTALGEPVAEGFLYEGSIKLVNNTGSADIIISLNGTKGSGKLHVVGSKTADKWNFTTMEVQTANEKINLLKDSDL